MQDRLAYLHSLAIELARDARPEQALRLECLTRFSLQELRQVESERQIDNVPIARIARDLGEPVDVVQHLVAEFFRLDMNLFGDMKHLDYDGALEFYRTCGSSLQWDVARFWAEESPAPEIAFLKFGCVDRWNPDTGELYDITIEEYCDSEVEDYRFDLATKGYFVARNLAFRSEVEFLAATFYDKWPNWDELWDRYYGWAKHWR